MVLGCIIVGALIISVIFWAIGNIMIDSSSPTYIDSNDAENDQTNTLASLLTIINSSIKD